MSEAAIDALSRFLTLGAPRQITVAAKGTHAGFDFVVLRSDQDWREAYHCAYIRIPNGHQWHGKHYDAINASVHGGLTFSKHVNDSWRPDGWWVGFDTGHFRDSLDEWPASAVTAEVTRLADQAEAAA